MSHLLRLSPQEQLALGDWASNNPEGNQMPLHYSSARYTLRCKALSLAAAWEVRGLEDWSAVTDTELGRIKGAVQSQVDDVIVGDRTTIFQAPVTTETLHRSLAPTRTWQYRAAKTRAKSTKEQVGKMPATLNGKVLTTFLKNGQSLCAGFQLGRCRLEEKDCASAHRCAVALRSGRACGGNHPAEVCYDKRALLAQTAKEPGPSGGTGQAILPQRRAATVSEPVGPSPKRAKQSPSLPLVAEASGAAASSPASSRATSPPSSSISPSKDRPKVATRQPERTGRWRGSGAFSWCFGRRARQLLVVPEEARRPVRGRAGTTTATASQRPAARQRRLPPLFGSPVPEGGSSYPASRHRRHPSTSPRCRYR